MRPTKCDVAAGLIVEIVGLEWSSGLVYYYSASDLIVIRSVGRSPVAAPRFGRWSV